jgi:pimeloyl-ACP methyl ester carboxylesterase
LYSSRWRLAVLAALCCTPLVYGASAPIVVGFVGGFVGHNNSIHNEVLLAERLKREAPAGTQVLMFENHHGAQALHEVLSLLDTDRDGTISEPEKRAARIVIYGHSWGASETVTLARALDRDEVPVLLTVQVDSVRKPGENDGSIPANVRQAANFFQLDGLLHGRASIHAADAAHTKILGNFQFDYKKKPVDLAGYPWYAKLFMRPHIEIESDPAVWSRVETMIRQRLEPGASN